MSAGLPPKTKSAAHLVVQLDGGIEAPILHQVVDQMVPADLDLGVAAGYARHQKRLVKAAPVERLGDMLRDVPRVPEVLELFLDGPFQLLCIPPFSVCPYF